MKRLLLLSLVSCVAVALSGCACGPWLMPPGSICDSSGGCGPCGATSCGATSCGPAACASTCAPACNDCGTACGDSCGDTCGAPCETACNQCVGASAAACGAPCGPLTWLFTLLSQGYCGQSCGEVWWGDWHGAPPDCCDPCDRCGEYTGRGTPVSEGCTGCSTCSTGGVRQAGAAHLATGRTNHGMVGRQVVTKSRGQHVTAPSSTQAPRLISVTDRAVDTNRPGSVPQATLPRQMPAHR
jgi:hypothetical protein